MQLNVNAPVLALKAGQVLTLDDAEGLRILTRTGTVWVTEEGSRKDHIVGPGDTLIVARPGRTVVQALKATWVSIGCGPVAANDSRVYFATSWHADGLRWIASLFHAAANFVERVAARPCERAHTDLLPAVDPADSVRQRIQARYF